MQKNGSQSEILSCSCSVSMRLPSQPISENTTIRRYPFKIYPDLTFLRFLIYELKRSSTSGRKTLRMLFVGNDAVIRAHELPVLQQSVRHVPLPKARGLQLVERRHQVKTLAHQLNCDLRPFQLPLPLPLLHQAQLKTPQRYPQGYMSGLHRVVNFEHVLLRPLLVVQLQLLGQLKILSHDLPKIPPQRQLLHPLRHPNQLFQKI